jgi:predicted ATPase/DNA-binding winged helix-turn-helix (wHTH) protein
MQALWRIGDLVVDGRRFEMRRRGEPVQTEPLAFELIRNLIEHRERVVTRDELTEALWHGRVVSPGSLGRVVSMARTALGDDATNPELIETVRGRGYRFVGDVEELAACGPVSAVSAAAPVGREFELERARELLAQGLESGRRVLLFSGEAGIGKTVMGEAVVREGERLGYRARVGRCADDEGVPPYWPWTQILRAEREARGADAFEALVGDLAHPLSAVFPIMARDGDTELMQLADAAVAATDQRSAPEHFGAFAAMTDVIRRLLREAPVIIFLDDLHFADLASLQLLRFLVRAIREPGLVIVGGYRDSVMRERSARGPLLADVTRAGSARTEPLAALSDGQIAELVHVRTGALPSAELTRELMEQTGGNPFLASQLLPLLQQCDDPLAALAPEGGLAKELPAGVRAGLMQQLHSLPEGCDEILGIAAVIGSEVDLDLLCAVTEHERGEVVDCLWAAEQAGLLRRMEGSADALRFAHLLIWDALREEMPPGRRGEVHHRTALALEERQLTHGEMRLTRLAHH